MNYDKQLNLIIDNDSAVCYEINNIRRKVFNFFLVSLLNIIPPSFQKIVKKTHKSVECIVDNATSHVALEILYKHGNSKDSKNLLHKIFHKVWFDCNNPKAVRNRLKLVEREIKKSVNELIQKNGSINILSIASGSSRAMVESVCNNDLSNVDISITFLDKNPKANEYSKGLTKKCPSHYNLRWIIDTASNFPNYFGENYKKLNLIEMVGLLDYFDDEKAIKVFSLIYNNLDEDGIFISGNISDNRERKFITDVIGWKMVYRSGEELANIAIKAGFKPERLKIIYEPLKIHAVLVAQK